MTVLRVGLVGAGMAAAYHVVCLRRVYGVTVEIAGVTSLRAESRARFGEEHGLPVYDSLEAMLDAVDVVDICTPPACHLDGIRLAAQSGKHLIVEKTAHRLFRHRRRFSG